MGTVREVLDDGKDPETVSQGVTVTCTAFNSLPTQNINYERQALFLQLSQVRRNHRAV